MILIDPQRCNGCGHCVASCPFAAITLGAQGAQIGAGCRACRLCLEACPHSAIHEEKTKPAASHRKQDYSGILVYVEHTLGAVEPVTYELIGKAVTLARPLGASVYALFAGQGVRHTAASLTTYGVDRVYVYDHPALKHFRADVYTNVFEDCVHRCMPSAVLVGATNTGRSLAPRVATRFGTGLTADCTGLSMRENTDLVQTRPAFGGNIMARIITEHHRPQFATVRYRVMDSAFPTGHRGEVEQVTLPEEQLQSAITLGQVRQRQRKPGIENAQALVVAGRGVQRTADLAMLEELARLLGGSLACTRPLVEKGMADYSMQIGLSGRSVRPRLVVACGVSGAVQFLAGMKGAEHVFAINTDPDAPIMQMAGYAAVGDLYEIVPRLIDRLRQSKGGPNRAV